MHIIDFEKLKQVERHARVNGPLMELLNERWYGSNAEDPAYIEALIRVQSIGQELLDLIIKGLL